MLDSNKGINVRGYSRGFFSKVQVVSLVKVLQPSEIIFILYILLTGIYIVLFRNNLHNYYEHLLIRLAFVTAVVINYFSEKKYPYQAIGFFRQFFPIAASGLYFYTETGFMNTMIFPHHLDPYLIQLEYSLFGCMPSDIFCVKFPHKWFNELLNFGYFSYFFIILIPLFVTHFIKKKITHEATFIALFSLLAFYLFFIVFPTAGPQFHYPDLTFMQNHIPDAYIFRFLVKQIQNFGETTTGAFPSSHVGVTLTMLYVTYKFSRKAFYIILPISILLFFSTVYIRAHYFVDVIGGVIFGVIFIILANLAFQFISKIKES